MLYQILQVNCNFTLFTVEHRSRCLSCKFTSTTDSMLQIISAMVLNILSSSVFAFLLFVLTAIALGITDGARCNYFFFRSCTNDAVTILPVNCNLLHKPLIRMPVCAVESSYQKQNFKMLNAI